MKPKNKKAKPAPGKCQTCSGYGWITSGVGHFGEQEGGHKGVMARCEHCQNTREFFGQSRLFCDQLQQFRQDTSGGQPDAARATRAKQPGSHGLTVTVIDHRIPKLLVRA